MFLEILFYHPCTKILTFLLVSVMGFNTESWNCIYCALNIIQNWNRKEKLLTKVINSQLEFLFGQYLSKLLICFRTNMTIAKMFRTWLCLKVLSWMLLGNPNCTYMVYKNDSYLQIMFKTQITYKVKNSV